jgi:hypothetical protein
VKPKASTADPMTDSDFFTESDADMHDELAAGSSRGDRRAQVIDGTLYGANLHTGGTLLLGESFMFAYRNRNSIHLTSFKIDLQYQI